MLKQVLFLEKRNKSFREMAPGSKQQSGLSVCIDQIVENIPDAIKMCIDSLEQASVLIQRFKPRIVIFEALTVDLNSAKALLRLYPKVRFYIHIHSNIPFLVEEGSAFHKIKSLINSGFGIIVNSVSARISIPGSVYLPNVYTFEPLERQKSKENELNVICPGSMRLMKNQAIQLLAARYLANKLGKKLKFHVNFSRHEGSSDAKSAISGIHDLLGDFEIVKMPWLDHKELLKYLTLMDLGMQVSLSESFNMATADMVAAGIPIVVSDAIDWVSKDSIAKTNDLYDIYRIANNAMQDDYLIDINRSRLRTYSEESIKRWVDFVKA